MRSKSRAVFKIIYIARKRIVSRIYFQQDGAPAHFSLVVRDWLNKKFPNRWISRAGPIRWPPKSPDLTPMDFFFWGYVKQVVYQQPIQDLNHLKSRIIEAVQSIQPDVLNSVCFFKYY